MKLINRQWININTYIDLIEIEIQGKIVQYREQKQSEIIDHEENLT